MMESVRTKDNLQESGLSLHHDHVDREHGIGSTGVSVGWSFQRYGAPLATINIGTMNHEAKAGAGVNLYLDSVEKVIKPRLLAIWEIVSLPTLPRDNSFPTLIFEHGFPFRIFNRYGAKFTIQGKTNGFGI